MVYEPSILKIWRLLSNSNFIFSTNRSIFKFQLQTCAIKKIKNYFLITIIIFVYRNFDRILFEKNFINTNQLKIHFTMWMIIIFVETEMNKIIDSYNLCIKDKSKCNDSHRFKINKKFNKIIF